MITKLICGMAALFLSTLVTAQKYSVTEVEKSLVSGSSQLNKTLPMWINKSVRLDTSFPGPGLKLTYVGTVMNSDTNTPPTASELNFDNLKPGICNDPNRKILLLNGVTFSYLFRRQDLKPIATKNIGAFDCGISAYK